MTSYQRYGRYGYLGLTFYDRLNFLIKLFHSEPLGEFYEKNWKIKFRDKFIPYNSGIKWWKDK
jgi:hypothetical protein